MNAAETPTLAEAPAEPFAYGGESPEFTSVRTITDLELMRDAALWTGRIACTYSHLGTGYKGMVSQKITEGGQLDRQYDTDPDHHVVICSWCWHGGAVRANAFEVMLYQQLYDARSTESPADSPGLFPFSFRVVGPAGDSPEHFIIVRRDQEEGHDCPAADPNARPQGVRVEDRPDR